MVDFAVFAPAYAGGGPRFPTVGFIEDVGVLLAIEGSFGCFVMLQGIQIFQEEEPRSLFGVVEFARATGVFPENVVDVLEGLFKHKGESLIQFNRGVVP